MLNLKKKNFSVELDWTNKVEKSSFFSLKKTDVKPIDLDLSITFLSDECRFIDRTVSYLNKNSRGVIYLKDDTEGDLLSDGKPNEIITLETALMNPEVRFVPVFINNLDGQLNSFNELRNATLTIKSDSKIIKRICLSSNSDFSDSNCTIAGYFDKENDWEFVEVLAPRKNKNIRNFELEIRDKLRKIK